MVELAIFFSGSGIDRVRVTPEERRDSLFLKIFIVEPDAELKLQRCPPVESDNRTSEPCQLKTTRFQLVLSFAILNFASVFGIRKASLSSGRRPA